MKFGKPFRCPDEKCGYGCLKTPQTPWSGKCPNCGSLLEPVKR